MNNKFIDFMYWLPVIMFIIAMLIYGIYQAGLTIIIFYLIFGIIFIITRLWFKYWIKKRYEVKD